MKNKFHIAYILIALIVAGSYAYSQYLRTKEHNLEVINSVRLCADDSLNESSIDTCAKAALREYVFTYKRLD